VVASSLERSLQRSAAKPRRLKLDRLRPDWRRCQPMIFARHVPTGHMVVVVVRGGVEPPTFRFSGQAYPHLAQMLRA
jgi:hypothetical protein